MFFPFKTKGKKMTTEETLALFSHNTQKIIGLEEIKTKLEEGRNLRVYWGTAPDRPPHIGHLCPLLKLRDLIGSPRCNVSIFLADLHAFLDGGAEAIPSIEARTLYYQFLFSTILSSLGVPQDSYTFVKGSEVQLQPVYARDLLRLSTFMTVRDSQRAGTGVVKAKENKISNLLYPLMQCLDETALEADVQIGGLDQEKLFHLAREYMPKIGYQKCSYLLNPLIPSLDERKAKMSSSQNKTTIRFTDSDEEIRRKIGKSVLSYQMSPEEASSNACLSLFKNIVFPIKGSVHQFSSYEELLESWMRQRLSPQDMKNFLTSCLIDIISPIRTVLNTRPELYVDAYGAN